MGVRLRRHRKINDPVTAAWAGTLAAFVLGKILEIVPLSPHFFLRARSRLHSADAPGLVSSILRCRLRFLPAIPFLLLLLTAADCAGREVGINDAKDPARAAPPVPPAAAAWPQADALFRSDERWLGGDAAYSVALDPERTLWLFGDSLISTSEAPDRASSTLVRNSIALQTGKNPSTASLTFYWRRDEKGSPASFFPERDRDWLWPADGVMLDGALTLFLYRVERDASPGSLGFDLTGWTAVRIARTQADPLQWELRELETPDAGSGVVVGAAVARREGYVHAYAVRRSADHQVLVLRWPDAALRKGDLTSPEWWLGPERGWGAGQGAVVMARGATEFSVDRLDRLSLWLQVQSSPFAGGLLGVRYAPRLTGPWSDICTIYRPPEAAQSDLLIYAGKAHSELEGADLVATYLANTLDLARLVRDTEIYYPRFVRMSERRLYRTCPPPASTAFTPSSASSARLRSSPPE